MARFRIIYPVGTVASLLLTPLITLFMWVGLLSLLLDSIGPFRFYLHRFADLIYHGIVLTASWFARMRGIELGDPVPILFYGTIVALIMATPFIPRKRSG